MEETAEKIALEEGLAVEEAHAPGVQWFRSELLNGMRFAWNWEDLLQNALTAGENRNLAIAGLVLSNDVEFAALGGETMLAELGFDHIRSEYYVFSTRTKNAVSKPARTFGHRKIEKDGKDCHIFCAVFKGSTTLPDVITDICSVVDGFYEGGRSCAESLKEYMDGFDGARKDNSILFITGHSLGASTANVAGRISRAFVQEESLFVYTFASPNYETKGEEKDGKTCPNFHYYTNLDDIVPKVPSTIPPFYFTKIGTEHRFRYSSMSEAQKQRFLRAYRYFRHMTFEEDTDLLGLGLKKTENIEYKALKNHLCHTYMSFLLSELKEEELDQFIPFTERIETMR